MKQVIVVRKDLKLGKGKMAAQASHASLEAYKVALQKVPQKVAEWELEGTKKVVLGVADEKELLSVFESIPKNIPKKLVRDAGMTQLEPGTVTCFAAGPWDDAELDKYTGQLKLIG